MTLTHGPTDSPNEAVIFLHDDVDLTTVEALERQLEQSIPAGATTAILDLSDVTFMDSSGIALLLRIAGRVPTLTIRQPSVPVALVLEATGLTKTLRIEP